jgi:hypothetical protein
MNITDQIKVWLIAPFYYYQYHNFDKLVIILSYQVKQHRNYFFFYGSTLEPVLKSKLYYFHYP